MTTYTLISALAGDGDVPGVDLGDLEATGGGIISPEDLRRLLDLPEVSAFCAENSYDPDHPDECMHLYAGELTSGRFETLTVTLPRT